jgi:hypothetical protein
MPDPDSDAEWVVPLRVRTAEGESRGLLEKPTQDATLPAGDLRTANVEGTGFYRVRLDDAQLARLAAEGPVGLSPIERYGLVDDTWAMVLAADVSVAQYVAVVRAFRDETDLSVWQRIIGSLDTLRRATTPAAAYQRWVLDLLAPARTRVGDEKAPGEDVRTGQLRGALLSAAGVLGADAAVVVRARSLVDAPGADPALLAAAIDIVAGHGTADDHRRYVERMKSSPSPQEAERYRGALADFREDEIRRTPEMTLDGSIRTQDASVVRRALRNHERGATAAVRHRALGRHHCRDPEQHGGTDARGTSPSPARRGSRASTTPCPRDAGRRTTSRAPAAGCAWRAQRPRPLRCSSDQGGHRLRRRGRHRQVIVGRRGEPQSTSNPHPEPRRPSHRRRRGHHDIGPCRVGCSAVSPRSAICTGATHHRRRDALAPGAF